MDTQAVTIKQRDGRKTKHETIFIPSNDILIEAALELRRLGGDTKLAAGQYDNCLGLYIPPSRDYYLTDVNPFTGNRGDTRKGGTTPATCAFWIDAEVRIAEAMYERDPIDIYYYCQKADGVQGELFDDNDQEEITEGSIRIVEQSQYERNPRLRDLSLRYHGCRCVVCGISFEDIYGKFAKGFIHVHHLAPLSSVGTAHAVDPKQDLVPVCPNCHAVIHLKDPPFDPDEVRKMIHGDIGGQYT